jgi:hypothetical protein
MAMRKSSIAALLAASCLTFGSPASAQSSPVIGSWETVADTPIGKLSSRVTFAKSGDAYTVNIKDAPIAPPEGAPAGGAAAGPPPESKISDVVVNGNNFSFKRSLTTDQGPMVLNYSGKVDGDKLTAQAASDFGDVPITGSRAQP